MANLFRLNNMQIDGRYWDILILVLTIEGLDTLGVNGSFIVSEF